MAHLWIKNWRAYQHYKHRSPPWIKLHTELLHDDAFLELPDDAKGLLPLLWLLAVPKDGLIPASPRRIAALLNLAQPPDLQPLIAAGFLSETDPASMLLATRLQPASNMLAQSRDRVEAEQSRNEKPLKESSILKRWKP